MKTLTPAERLDAKLFLTERKGRRFAGTDLRYGQAVTYNGERWLVYDQEARVGGNTLVLISPDLKTITQGVSMARYARFEEGEKVDVPEYLRDAGNPEAAKKWEEMNELHGDRFKTAGIRLARCKIAAGKPHLFREGLDKEAVRSGLGAMLYFIDEGKNHSKFYEMLVASQGGQYLLKRRWGALTDQNGGRISEKDELFRTEQDAKRALATIKLEKTRKGYIDAFGPNHEMNGRKLPMGEYPVGLNRQVGFGWGTQSIVKVVPQLKGVLTQVQQAYQQMERGSSIEMISNSIQSAEHTLLSLERNDEGSMISKLLEQIAPISRMIQNQDPETQNDVKLTLALNRFINYLTKQLSVAHA